MTYFKIILAVVIFALLIVTGWVVSTMRSEGAELVRDADRFNVPVVNQLMMKLQKWDYESLLPYMNKSFKKTFSKQEFQKELDNLSILGNIKAIKHIRHSGHKRYKHWLFHSCAVNKYSVSTEFEKGKGTVVMDLNHCYKKVKVTFFQVHSKVLPVKPQHEN